MDVFDPGLYHVRCNDGICSDRAGETFALFQADGEGGVYVIIHRLDHDSVGAKIIE